MGFDRDDVLARIDLRDLADRLLGPRHPRTRTWRCPNPGHAQTGRTPPVTVFTDHRTRQRWHCHACGDGGTAIDLVLSAGPAGDFVEALTWLADRANVSPLPRRSQMNRRTTRAPATTFSRVWNEPDPHAKHALASHAAACAGHLHSTGGQDVRVWLTERRATPLAVLVHVGVGADPGPQRLPRPTGIPRQTPAAVFPVRRNGEVVFVQSRLLAPRGDQPRWLNTASTLASNPRLAFYDPPGRPRSGPVVVTEGAMDALSAVSAGLPAAALLGSGAADDQVIDQLAQLHRPLLLATDNDDAGHRVRSRLRSALGQRGATVSDLVIPEGFGDLNDWHIAHRDDWAPTLRAAIRLEAVADRAGSRLEAPGVA